MSEDNTSPEGGPPPQQKSKFMLILVIVVPLLLILIGVGVFLFLTPAGQKLLGHGAPTESSEKESSKQSASKKEHYVYYDLPDILVNIVNQNSKRAIFLKLGVYLEIKDEKDKPNLDKVKPKILDQFQVYLRGLRIEDLQGSSGLQRLRSELLERAQEAAGDVEIHDVLFKEMLIQ